MIAAAMHPAYNYYFPMINDCFLMISPEHYDCFSNHGVTSKEELKKRLWEACNRNMAPSLSMAVERKVGGIAGTVVGYAMGAVARGANILTGKGLSTVPKFDSPDSFHIIVAGGEAGPVLLSLQSHLLTHTHTHIYIYILRLRFDSLSLNILFKLTYILYSYGNLSKNFSNGKVFIKKFLKQESTLAFALGLDWVGRPCQVLICPALSRGECRRYHMT